MIMDHLTQWPRYGIFARAFEYLQTLSPTTPDGRYELDGDRLYCLVQRYRSKPLAEAKFEAHRVYADIQLVLAGRETMLWAPLAELPVVTKPYEPDVAFFGPPAAATALKVLPGHFTIFFPEDGHAPGLECDGATDVVKAVVKVRL